MRRVGCRGAVQGIAIALLLWLTVACGARSPRPVILIVVDTLRADHLGFAGYERPISPSLDRYVQQGAVFDNAFSSTCWTLPALGTLLTGYLPTRHSAGTIVARNSLLPPVGYLKRIESHMQRMFLRLDGSLATLADRFKQEGYDTGAIINNAFLNARFGVASGFDMYDYAPMKGKRIRDADETVDLALSWIDERPRDRFFLMLHFMDPHMPYNAPEPFAGMFTGDVENRSELQELNHEALREVFRSGSETARQFHVGAYDEEIAFVDHELGRFFDNLQSRGLWDDAMIVFTSDHGEEFNEHGKFEHGHSMVNELVKIPLVVWGPGIRVGRYEAPVSLADLPTTILDAAGFAIADDLHGISLWEGLTKGAEIPTNRPIIAEKVLYGKEKKAVIRWPYKAIFDEAAGGTRVLFDLRTDPGERHDLSSERSDVLGLMWGELEQQLAAARPPDEAQEATLDRDTLERLRDLGYIR